MNIFIRSSCCP